MPLTNHSAGLKNWTESETLYSGKYYTRFVPSSSQTNVDAIVSPKGNGGFSLQQADGTINGGNARGQWAVDLQTVRSNAAQVASGNYSFAQGSHCTSSGSYSFAIGYFCTASGDYSFSQGVACTASGGYSFAQGNYSTASASISSARGNGAVIAIIGADARASFSFVSYGDSQNVKVPLGVATTTATPAVLASNTLAVSTNNQCVLQNNQTVAFTALISAKKSGSTTSVAGWIIKGVASRGANAASTVINASSIEVLHNPDNWTIAVSADTTNGAVAFTFTGAAATNIRVHCDVEMAQIIYA